MTQDEPDRGLDALAALLRVWAAHPLSLPGREAKELACELEAWALHALVGKPPPGAPAGDRERSAAARRDWLGLRRFLTALRSEEAQFVKQAVGDFRQTVQTMVARVRDALAEERIIDARLASELQHLRVAVASDDLAQLKSAAMQAADVMTSVLESHRERQAAQEVEMSARLNTLGQKLETAQRQAEEDALTGLVNRRGFDSELEKAAGLGAQFQVPSSLLIIDLDHFKRVNDTHGHPGGDATLRAVADILTRAFPRRGDCVARYGGEEFAVILRDSRLSDAQRLAERFVTAMRALRLAHQGREIRLTASVGVAELCAGESSVSWVGRADKAVYSAKTLGRDRFVLG